MSKIALITDTHFGVRSNNPVLLEKFRNFLQDKFFPTLVKQNITKIFHLGDVFDKRKEINFVTYKKCKEIFFEEIKKRNLELYVVVGNHDCFYGSTNDLNSPQQLIDYYCKEIYIEPKTITVYDKDILILPWITPENKQQTLEEIKNTKAKIIFGHLEIKGFNMSQGVVSMQGFNSEELNKFDKVYSGHFHLRQITDKVIYLGTPYQMTWTDYNEKKGFYILNLENNNLEFIENKYESFKMINYNSKEDHDEIDVNGCYVKLKINKRDNPFYIDQLIKKIQDQKPIQYRIIEDVSIYLKENDQALYSDKIEDTSTIMREYIKNAEVSVSKDNLIILMDNLYKEAVNVN